MEDQHSYLIISPFGFLWDNLSGVFLFGVTAWIKSHLKISSCGSRLRTFLFRPVQRRSISSDNHQNKGQHKSSPSLPWWCRYMKGLLATLVFYLISQDCAMTINKNWMDLWQQLLKSTHCRSHHPLFTVESHIKVRNTMDRFTWNGWSSHNQFTFVFGYRCFTIISNIWWGFIISRFCDHCDCLVNESRISEGVSINIKGLDGLSGIFIGSVVLFSGQGFLIGLSVPEMWSELHWNHVINLGLLPYCMDF